MATLKELLAAKQAAAAAAKPAPTEPTTPTPPPAAQATGLVIRPAAAAPLSAAGPTQPETRPLGDTSAAAADIPFEFASEKSSEAERLWLEARRLPETELGIYIEPEPSRHAWLAIDLKEDRGRLLLLQRLPLLFKRCGNAPF